MSTPGTRRRRLRRAAPLALAAVLVMFMLSGCIVIKTVAFTQEGALGKIDLAVTGCASKQGSANCGPGTLGGDDQATQPAQVLLGIQIDARLQPPDTFTTGFPDLMSFSMSPSYTAELTRLRPPAAGMKWVGYITDTAHSFAGDQRETATIPITRPLGPDGLPVTGSGVGARVVLGARWVTSALPASRAVDCGTTLSPTMVGEITDVGTCDDSELFAFANGFNEFTFLAPAPVTAAPGTTAVIPVSGRLSGPAAPAVNFALAATTTLPGATALVNVPTLAPPGDSTTSVAVSVQVPASAKPGTYTVTLTGTLSTGETRSATGTLIVSGGGGGTAGLATLSRLRLSHHGISSARGAAPATLTVALSQPGTLVAVLEKKTTGHRNRAGRCVAGPGRPHCRRFVPAGRLTKRGLGTGVATILLTGRLHGRALPSGTYRLTLTLRTAGGQVSAPLRTTLRIHP